MKITIDFFGSDNDYFENTSVHAKVHNILRAAQSKVGYDTNLNEPVKLFDVNGNHVATLEVTE